MNEQTRHLLDTWDFDDTPAPNGGLSEREFITEIVEHHGVELKVENGELICVGIALKEPRKSHPRAAPGSKP